MAMILSDEAVARLKPPKGRRRDIGDRGHRGLFIRVTPHGSKAWYANFSLAGQRIQEWLGTFPAMNLMEARTAAAASKDMARMGIDPRALRSEERAKNEADRKRRAGEAERNRFGDVVTRYCEARAKNRSIDETRRTFDRYFFEWQDRDIRAIRRADIEARLDAIAGRKVTDAKGKKRGGPVARECAPRQPRSVLRWHEIAEGELSGYRAPVLRGLTKLSMEDIERDHVLIEDEIAGLWDATSGVTICNEAGPHWPRYCAIVRLLLLSAQRRAEVGSLKRVEIDKHGVWWLPRKRNKNRHLHGLPLTPRMLEIVGAQRVAGGWIFSNNGHGGFVRWSRSKAALDVAMLEAMRKRAEARGDDPDQVELRPWRLHDLRRTGATIMERLKVDAVHIERVLGHKQAGIAGTYKKHQYIEEKRRALAVLEAEIMRIVKPPKAKVIRVRGRRRQTSAMTAEVFDLHGMQA